MKLGYSFCPNDTFIFHALTHGLVKLDFRVEEVLEDVETLNQWAAQGRLELTKESYHAFFHVLPQYVALRSGGALGRGVGPLLVAKPGSRLCTVATPGPWTTAHLLLQLARPELDRVVSLRYDAIIPAILADEVDGGVLIHESRFAYEDYGLEAVLDLGQWWEGHTGLPLPLGVILARRDLGSSRLMQIQDAVRASLNLAYQQPQRSRAYIAQHAAELSASVIEHHIATYVNKFSLDVGNEGEQAVRELWRQARQAKLVPEFEHSLFVS